MINKEIDSNEASSLSEKRLSQKEFAKKMRREAYLRAKERSKKDPRLIELKERLKSQRKEAYKKAKAQHKTFKETLKNKKGALESEEKAIKMRSLMKLVVSANNLENVRS